MALIKHRYRKTQHYSDALNYLYYQHEKDKYKHYHPVLHENGYMIERDNCIVTCITAEGNVVDPEFWESLCMRAAWLYGKDRVPGGTTMHHYIISHAKKDGQRLSDEALLQKGKAVCSRFFSGSDALIAVHRDTEHTHLHIVIGAVRRLAREPQDWMMRGKTGDVLPCEIEAGGKHQSSPDLWKAMTNWDMQYAEEHGLTKEDFARKAAENKEKKFGKRNEQLRAAVIAAAEKSANMQDLQQVLLNDYEVQLRLSARDGAIRLLGPGQKKTVGLSVLNLTQEEVVGLFIRDDLVGVDQDALHNAKAVAQAEAYAKEEEERRRRELEEVRRKRREAEEKKDNDSYFETSKINTQGSIKFYDEFGREISRVEAIFTLLCIIIFNRTDARVPSTIHPDKLNEACYATRDWKVQKMIDNICIARELGVTGEKDVDERLKANRKIYYNAKEEINRNTPVKERLQDLAEAIQEFEDTRRFVEAFEKNPEGPEKEVWYRAYQKARERHQAAKAVMDLYDITFDEQREEFKVRWKKLVEGLEIATEQLEQSKREYPQLEKLKLDMRLSQIEVEQQHWKQSREEELSKEAEKKIIGKKRNREQER